MITFTYHENIDEASKFYGEALGLERVMDRDWVKIYRVSTGGNIGLVDGKRGYLRPSKDKPVMLSIMVSDIEAWYRRLTERGVKVNHPPRQSDDIHMKGFLTWDPSGYVIEFLEFLTQPYGE